MIHPYDESNPFILTSQSGKNPEMLMDIQVYFLKEGETKVFCEEENEIAILLVQGALTYCVNEKTLTAKRDNYITEKPFCVHSSRGKTITITSLINSEVLVQKTANPRIFDTTFYTPEQVADVVLCENLMDGTAKRILRDIFTYENAPYSNMVMGELITLAGRWSSYPPHHHPQPEVYYYRFEKPQGFGVSIIGEDAFVAKDKSFVTIPGGLCHPQVAAPGYPMYYCWMIRHLENNPWTTRIDDPAHQWLYES